MKISRVLISFVTAVSSHVASAQIFNVCESSFPYSYDSGLTTKVDAIISYEEAPWIQLDLRETTLSPGAELILTGGKATEIITADSIATNGFSAVFDGSSVTVELSNEKLLRGSSPRSRVVVSNVKVGLCEDDNLADSICDGTDDREPSTDVRAGRIGGCTGWLISENEFIQAGHCGAPSSYTRIHFTYGNTNAPPEDQYAVDVSTYRFDNGFGTDWGAGRLLPNSVTGKLPGVAQSEKAGGSQGWYNLGTVPSDTNGNNIRITGYGVYSEPDGSGNTRKQKTHVGPLVGIAGNYIQYRPDTSGGNSGSPVIHEETGDAIGVHTHGGCGDNGSGGNHGTRIDLPEFAAHVEFLLRTCTTDADCDDGLFCNGVETCSATGECNYGTPPSCDDGLSCTQDVCNEAEGRCENPPTDCSVAATDSCSLDVCIEEKGGCQFSCGATLDAWYEITGHSISNLMQQTNNLNDTPSKTERLGLNDLLESQSNIDNDYGLRMTGYLVPPVTGGYEFWIASDDNGEFYLSTDGNPANKVLMCKVPGWTSSREWTKYDEQHSLFLHGSLVQLEEGKSYYFEALMKEGGGGDNLALAWQYPGQTQTVIPAKYSAMEPNSSLIVGETGRKYLSNTVDKNIVENITFRKQYINPVVVAFINTRNGDQSVSARVRNVSPSGCQLFMQEPDNESHKGEWVSYIVVESGRHTLEGGIIVEADVASTTIVHRGGQSFTGHPIQFNQAFSDTPAILHSLMTHNNNDFMASLVTGSNPYSFKVAMEAAETNKDSSGEDVGWIAFSSATGLTGSASFTIGTADDGTNDGVTNSPHVINLSAANFDEAPDIVVSLYGARGKDGSWARGAGVWSKDAQHAYAEEDQVSNTERAHIDEQFAWAAFTPNTDLIATASANAELDAC